MPTVVDYVFLFSKDLLARGENEHTKLPLVAKLILVYIRYEPKSHIYVCNICIDGIGVERKLPILRAGESIVTTERAKYGGTMGILCLTNKRILFEHEAGLITKRTYVSLDIALQDVLTVTIEGRFRQKLVVLAKGRAGRIELEVQDPYGWADKIQKIMSETI